MERLFDTLLSPVVTEKSMMGGESNQYVFRVLPSASKQDIKEAVEKIFKVSVDSVNTLNRAGKEKRFRGLKGVRKATKRAIVRLKEGQKLDILPN